MHARTIISLLLAAVAALVFCPAVSAANPVQAAPAQPPVAAIDLWSYALPEAKFVAGVDWRRAKSSGTGAMLMRRLMPSQGGKGKFTQGGMEFVDSLDRLLISAPEGAAGGQRGLIVMTGRFDRAKLKKSMPAGTAIERMKGIDLFVPPTSAGEDMVAGWVNETLMLVGDRGSVVEVLDAGTGLRDANLLARARQMEAENEIWLIADAPPSSVAGTIAGASQGIGEIRSMDLGINLRQGLGLKANLTMMDAEKAQGLAMLGQMVSALPPDPRQRQSAFAEIARNIQLKVEGAVVRLDLQMPLSQLERAAVEASSNLQAMSRKSLESLIGVGGGGPMPGLRPAVKVEDASQRAASRPPASPSIPTKRTIRIVGLEEGDKEISYTSTTVQR